MKIPFVDLKVQYESIKAEIDGAIKQIIDSSAFIGGEAVRNFESNFAKFCGNECCVAVGNGTDAITLSLRGLGIGAGDEVITAANTFIATAEAITNAGARVVFADCDPRTYTIEPASIEQNITPRTRAIIPVHLYGQPADMDPILFLASRKGLRVIEDAAQAHGATYKGRPVGCLGDVACFSFYPGKNLGAYGDAGAVVANDEKLVRKIRMLANHGRTQKYDHEFEGVNSRMDGLQAAILDAKLVHLSDWNGLRRQNAQFYREYLLNADCVLPFEREGITHVYHLFVVRVKDRNRLRSFLKNRGIDSGIHYPISLPRLSAYKHLGYQMRAFPVAEECAEEVLSLPMFPELTRAQIEYVANTVKEFAEV